MQNSKSIKKQWNLQKENKPKQNKYILRHIVIYFLKSNYQKWICVQDDFLHSKIKWSTVSPWKHGTHIQLPKGNMILPPTLSSCDWWVTLGEKHMAESTQQRFSKVHWARWLAFVFDYMYLLWWVGMGGERRAMVPGDEDVGTRWH